MGQGRRFGLTVLLALSGACPSAHGPAESHEGSSGSDDAGFFSPPADGAFSPGDGGDGVDRPPPASDDGGEAPPPATAPVRFVVLGDGGTGGAPQYQVADAMARVCAVRGCDFALYNGDNIYESGVTGIDDAQFVAKFEDPYAALDFPFYMALGNHDYGSGGSNYAPEDPRSEAQVEYTAHSSKWTMPHQYYTFRYGPVQFFAIDTNAILLGRFRPLAEQEAWMEAELAASDAPWKIVFGHHPYLSNGQHGNATSPALIEFVRRAVCSRAQIYFAGHDHDREWLEPVCGTSFIVSGAAARLRVMAGDSQPTRFQDGKKYGFLWVEIAGDVMTGVFYDAEGHVDYEDTVLR